MKIGADLRAFLENTYQEAMPRLLPAELPRPDLAVYAAYWLLRRCGGDGLRSCLTRLVPESRGTGEKRRHYDLPQLCIEGFCLREEAHSPDEPASTALVEGLTRIMRRKPHTDELSGPADDPLGLLGLLLLATKVAPQLVKKLQSWANGAALSPTLRAAYVLGGIESVEHGVHLDAHSPSSVAAYLQIATADPALGRRLYPATHGPEVIRRFATIDVGSFSPGSFDALAVLVTLELLLQSREAAALDARESFGASSTPAQIQTSDPHLLNTTFTEEYTQPPPAERNTHSVRERASSTQHPGAKMKKLEDLLSELFSADEFRRWISHTHSEIYNDLPGRNESSSALFHEAAGILKRRGLINANFFHSLKQDRDKKTEAIDAVAVLWCSPPATPIVRKTNLLTLQAPIAGLLSLIDDDEVRTSLAPDIVAECLHIGLGEFSHTPSGWLRGREYIHEKVQTFLTALCSSPGPTHLSIFGLAPIPWLVALGYSLSETVSARVFNRLRDPPTWTWERQSSAADTWRMTRLWGSVKASEGIVVVSASAPLHLERIAHVVDPQDRVVYSISIDNPRLDAIRSEEQLQSFAQRYREVLSELEQRHPDLERIHLFVAGPVAVAIECGRRVLHSSTPPIVTYNYVRGVYERALVLEP